MARQTALPPNLPPRIISREAAAAYIGVSPTTFDNMVGERLMPNPSALYGRRRGWDVRRLDIAIDALPQLGPDDGDRSDPAIIL